MEKELELLVCAFMPEVSELKEGIFYSSYEHSLAIHLCPCGCKLQTVTPLKKDQWQISFNENRKFSLTPSLLNRSCNTHYFITDNKIVYA
jgi:hypothetical protein